MPMKFFQSFFLTYLTNIVTGLSTRQVSFPLISDKNTEHDIHKLRRIFQNVVDSSEFFVQTSISEKERSICSVPLLGQDIRVNFQSEIQNVSSDEKSKLSSLTSEFVLSVEASGSDEFGWICVKFYESKELLQDIVDISNLQARVIYHYNRQPPHPGFDAKSAVLSGTKTIQDMFDKGAMAELEQKGFLVLGNGPRSTELGHTKLTKYLVDTTNQDADVRTDTVHFLGRDEAKQCGFQEHFDTLMGIASFLNTNLNFRASPHQPMNPATQESPLTIPLAVQLAEYAENDFYRAHSDNSLTKSFDQNGHRLRNNFRHYTCILYCNDAWDKEDGGALRLYPNTRKLLSVEDAIVNDYNYIDVTPQDGRLIIFDSCLIHSVEKVTHAAKKRRALTLWISRPDDSGVKGEEYY